MLQVSLEEMKKAVNYCEQFGESYAMFLDQEGIVDYLVMRYCDQDDEPITIRAAIRDWNNI